MTAQHRIDTCDSVVLLFINIIVATYVAMYVAVHEQYDY